MQDVHYKFYAAFEFWEIWLNFCRWDWQGLYYFWMATVL